MAKLPVMAATLLAFDTSTESMAVGLLCARGDLAWNGEGGAQASVALLPRIHALLAQQAITIAQVEAVAFGCGPGAFTGLRTACSVAQGLAYGAGKPVLPVDSLLIVAEDARAQCAASAARFDVGVAMDARMGQLYAARYRWAAGRWHVQSAPLLCGPAALPLLWGGEWPAVLAGSGLSLLDPAAVGALPVLLPRATDRAAALMRLARQLHAEGAGVEAAQALPVYLRDKVAQTTLERATAARS